MGGGGKEPGFYVDDGQIVGRDPDWVKEELTMMVDMFIKLGLETNL